MIHRCLRKRDLLLVEHLVEIEDHQTKTCPGGVFGGGEPGIALGFADGEQGLGSVLIRLELKAQLFQ